MIDAREMGDRVQRRDGSECLLLESHLAQIGVDERHTCNVPPSELDLPLGDIDTDDVEPLRQPERRRQARAAAEIEHGGAVR